MRLLFLPTVLRAAGLTVFEVDGWRTRGADTYGPVRGATIHATAGSRTSTDAGEINVLLNGSTSAPPPIAQLYLSRSGAWYVVASGLCFHNRVGWGGPNEGHGNDALLGIEGQNDNRGEPWPEVQYRSYVRGVAALVRHKVEGFNITVSRVAGHKEHQPGNKTDPTFSMAAFRTAVQAEINNWDNPPEDDDVSWTDPIRLNNSTRYFKDSDEQFVDVPAGTVLAQMAYYVQDERRKTANILAGVAAADEAVEAKLRPLLDELGVHVSNVDEAVDVKVRPMLDDLLLQVQGVDENVIAALGAAEQTPEQIADILRPVLGDKAAAVGQALATV